MNKLFAILAITGLSLFAVPADKANAGIHFGFSNGDVRFTIGSHDRYRSYAPYRSYNRYSYAPRYSAPRYVWRVVGYRSCGTPIYRRVRVW